MNPDDLRTNKNNIQPKPESAPDLPPFIVQAMRALENAIYNEYLNCGKRDDAFADLRALQDTLTNCPTREHSQ